MAKKKEPTFKVKLEGFSGFTIRDIQVTGDQDGIAEIPEWMTSTPEFLRMVDELAVQGKKIANLGSIPEPDVVYSAEPEAVASPEEVV